MKRSKFNWFMWQGVGASCWFMWTASTFLSYWGFVRLAPNSPTWVRAIAFGISASINFVEFMGDNFSIEEFKTVKYVRDVILRAFWLICYAYDIYTNVLGFIGVVGIPTASILMAFQIEPTMATFATLFGVMVAIGPEPLYIYFLEKNFPFPGTLFPAYATAARTTYTARPQTKTYEPQKPATTVNTGMKTLNGMTPIEFMEHLRKAREGKE